MRKFYFVQPNNSLSSSLFLPYATGCIAAYVLSKAEIRNYFEFGGFFYKKEEVNTVVEKMDSPAVVGFSCYMWNVNYNLKLAKAVKKKFPQCIIVFGGPQIPNNTEYLEKYPYIDILMHGQGEVSFYNFLIALKNSGDYSLVDNISFRRNGVIHKTIEKPAEDIVNFPSPYINGIFDSIINDPENKDVQIDAIIETNRGCPYQCIYCYWANKSSSLLRFPLEKVKAELLWMAEHKIAYCICADSNFGILERDEKIVDYIIELKKIYGYPEAFETTAAKNKDDFVFYLNKKLESANLNRGISVAVQSMSPIVLDIIGRKNVTVENLSKQLKQYRDNNMFTYTDIILGLPGETRDSFIKGLFDVIEAGQHTSININRLELLPNTTMYDDEYIIKYKIKTIVSELCQNHSSVNSSGDTSSRSEIVVSTSSMTEEDWKDCVIFSSMVLAFHSLGLTRFSALYFRKKYNISYQKFYEALYSYVQNESVFIKSIISLISDTVDKFLNKNGNLYFADERFGPIYFSFEEGIFLSAAAEKTVFYDEISEFIKFNFESNEEIEDLITYQKNIIITPGDKDCTAEFSYDWRSFFEMYFLKDNSHPEKRLNTVLFCGCETDSFTEYARKYVWYGKRSQKMIANVKEYRKC